MNRANSITLVADVEQEIQNECFNNFIPKQDALLFAQIDQYNLYPVETFVDSEGNIQIEDVGDAAYKELYLGTKNQFIHKRYKISYSSIRLDLDKTFATAWNPNNFIIFRNGYLLNSVLYNIIIPTFTSAYTVKCIYSQTRFLKGDLIDVFYIDGYDKFKPIKFNQDIYIKTVKVYCEEPGQTLVKIPYPYESYPKGNHMFYVFNTQNKTYLSKKVEDYNIDTTNEYIVLRDSNILQNVAKDSVTFTFPYCVADFATELEEDGIGEKSGILFTQSSYEWQPRTPNEQFSLPNGILEFQPKFTRYKFQKKNFLLFMNSIFLDPNRYEVIDNNHIKLLDASDIAHAEFARFNMFIFNELDGSRFRSFEMQTYRLVPIRDGQTEFDLPDINPEFTDFLIFERGLFFDVADKYTWDQINNKIILNENRQIKKGEEIVVIFYTNVPDRKIKRTIELVKIKFTTSQEDSLRLSSDKYPIKFTKQNLILFQNGRYLDPIKYEISDSNILTFTNPLDKLRKNKAFTGVYLVSHVVRSDDDSELYDGMNDGYPDKVLWFSEMYSRLQRI